MKLTISRKLLIGYLIMALLTVLASTYALWNLRNLQRVADEITNHDFVVVETCKSMMDSLLAQESAEKKYFIFKDPSLEEIFQVRSKEFKAGLEKISKINIPAKGIPASANIALLHDRYDVLFYNEISLIKQGRILEAQNISDTESRMAIDEIAQQVKGILKKSEKAISDDMNMIASQGRNAIRMTIGISIFSLILGITLALLITRSIAKPLKQLQKATRLIAEGNLDHQIKNGTNDEIGALAEDFAHMTRRLKILEAMNLDASPLTGLPGNLAIEKRLKELLAQRKMFSLCQVDLDNFKPFADKYGYAWGSEVIKEVADILKEAVGENKQEDVFIGHIGGDDFVVIAEPAKAAEVCRKLVDGFEKRIWKFYDINDAENGYIMGHDRQGALQKFPLITISVAMVTDDGSRFANPLDMAMTTAELKEYAKSLPGSNYVTQEMKMEIASATKQIISSLAILLLLFTGCAATTATVKESGKEQVNTEKKANLFGLSDTEKFREALSSLGSASEEGLPDYDEAKEKLAEFIATYPKSKWTSEAQDLIRTLNYLDSLQTKLKTVRIARDKAQNEKIRTGKDNEALKKEIKSLEADIARIQAENDQLKNDIRLLKNLEIKLDKREKTLR